MKKTHPLITGTLILTITGMVSRLIGFLYRIYLSRLFGEEGMGIYQLLGPVLALSFSLSAAGLQTAISKHVAAETTTGNYRASAKVLSAGLLISLLLSALCTWFVTVFSEWLAADFLLEPRTASMLRIIALSIPLGAVHSCINGYFYGIKKTGIPSATQLVEQLCRVGCVFFAGIKAEKMGITPTINVAVIGLVIGEGIAMCISIIAIMHRFWRLSQASSASISPAPLYASHSASMAVPGLTTASNALLSMALPLSATRIVINLLQSVEAVYIPNKLQVYGYDTATSLSVYGVLTGMAFPLVFFPSALTNSICVLLLPIISEADESGDHDKVQRATKMSILFSFYFGGFCTLLFFLFGKSAGNLLFDSRLAGHFIVTLSFICPFLYLSATMSSILHGLGKTAVTFVLNVAALCIRLFFVFFLIPGYGITGYLWGLLLSHISTTWLEVLAVKHYTKKH